MPGLPTRLNDADTSTMRTLAKPIAAIFVCGAAVYAGLWIVAGRIPDFGIKRFESDDILYSNFSLCHEYGTDVYELSAEGQPDDTGSYAMQMSHSKPASALVSIELGLGMVTRGSNHAVVSICADADGVPGEALESAEVLDQLMFMPFDVQTNTDFCTSVRFAGTTLLHPRKAYWIVVKGGPGARLGWINSATNDDAKVLHRYDGRGWKQRSTGRPVLSLRVRGNP